MKFKVLEVYEKFGSLSVKVEHKYGIETIGLLPESKFLNPETEEPKWVDEVKELLYRKYEGPSKKKQDIEQEFWKEYDTEKDK